MADQGTEGLLSAYLRNERLKAARPFIRGRVLDVGCGSGALAGFVAADRYVGVDKDQESLERARQQYPQHQFFSALPPVEEVFDTIVSLAVIEHVPQPIQFLNELKARLGPIEENRVVITTPHPAFDWIHSAGAAIGLFSSHASEEHEALLGKNLIAHAAESSGLYIETYRRFLFGANQLAVLKPIPA